MSYYILKAKQLNIALFKNPCLPLNKYIHVGVLEKERKSKRNCLLILILALFKGSVITTPEVGTLLSDNRSPHDLLLLSCR